jgi:hypothetical protein
MSGCMKLLLVVGVLAIVAVFLLLFVLNSFIGNLTGNLGGGDGDGGGLDGNCAFLSDGDARNVFGGNADAIELSGLYDASIGLIIDKRALANAPDCWVTEGENAYIARIALHQGGDAGAVFAAEREAAEPVTEDQGGGISVTREGYNAGPVSGLGDEAFCTGISPAIMAGVLVRQGDKVVYVSVGPANENEPPAMVPNEDGVIAAPELCDFAQVVAREILN